MRKLTMIVGVVAVVCLVATWAQEPLREFQGPAGGGGSYSATPVDVMNFPTDGGGRLLMASGKRVVEQYLELYAADACLMGSTPGDNNWRLAIPAGGPWDSVSISLDTTYPHGGAQARFAVSEWSAPDGYCETVCSCGKLNQPLTLVDAEPHTVAGNELLLRVVNPLADPVRVYIRWVRYY
jgi:hypothetical protein